MSLIIISGVLSVVMAVVAASKSFLDAREAQARARKAEESEAKIREMMTEQSKDYARQIASLGAILVNSIKTTENLVQISSMQPPPRSKDLDIQMKAILSEETFTKAAKNLIDTNWEFGAKVTAKEQRYWEIQKLLKKKQGIDNNSPKIRSRCTEILELAVASIRKFGKSQAFTNFVEHKCEKLPQLLVRPPSDTSEPRTLVYEASYGPINQRLQLFFQAGGIRYSEEIIGSQNSEVQVLESGERIAFPIDAPTFQIEFSKGNGSLNSAAIMYEPDRDVVSCGLMFFSAQDTSMQDEVYARMKELHDKVELSATDDERVQNLVIDAMSIFALQVRIQK